MVINKLCTDALRLLAIALVVNSHMDIFYPVQQFGTGGAIGNSLFFMLSAYGITVSERSKPQSFSSYLGKRVLRVYIPTWTCIIFLILPVIYYYSHVRPETAHSLVHYVGLDDPLRAIGILFYPPPDFWFLDALMFYYVVGFFLVKFYRPTLLALAVAVAMAIYISMYLMSTDFSLLIVEQEIRFKLVFYFITFLFGIYLAENWTVARRSRSQTIFDIVMMALALLIMYGHKILMARGMFSSWQFIQQIMIFPILLALIRLVNLTSVVKVLSETRFLNHVIALGASMTLELYLTHGPLRAVMYSYLPGFPLNVVLYTPVVVMIAYSLYRINALFRVKAETFLARIAVDASTNSSVPEKHC